MNGKPICQMALVLAHTRTAMYMKGHGKKVLNMDKECTNSLMVMYLLEVLLMTRQTVKASSGKGRNKHKEYSKMVY